MKNFSYSVKVKLRTDKLRADGTCPIFLQLILNCKTKKLSVKGSFINPKHWESTIGRAKGKGYIILNDMLDKKEQNIKAYFN